VADHGLRGVFESEDEGSGGLEEGEACVFGGGGGGVGREEGGGVGLNGGEGDGTAGMSLGWRMMDGLICAILSVYLRKEGFE
jgi:hypothetical protein